MNPGDTLDDVKIGTRDGEVALIINDMLFAMSPSDALVIGNAMVAAAQIAGHGTAHEAPKQVM